MVVILFANIVKIGYLYSSKTLKVKPIKPKNMKANIETVTPILLSELRNRNHEVGYSDREDGDHYESNYLWL